MEGRRNIEEQKRRKGLGGERAKRPTDRRLSFDFTVHSLVRHVHPFLSLLASQGDRLQGQGVCAHVL
jgi:hypothetical protein